MRRFIRSRPPNRKNTTTLSSVLKISEREEQQRRVAGQVVALDDAVDDRAEDADRREAAGGRAVDDHQAHQDRVDLELARRSRARSAR